jgi:hypothetical protein
METRACVPLALALVTGLGARSAVAAPVRGQIVDDASGKTVAARAYLCRGDEPLLPPGFSSYSQGDERHFLVPGEFALDLEPGRYRLRIERGLEYIPVEVDLDVPQDTMRTVRLRRWVDMSREGWYSADMHVHRDPAEVPLILRAEDLNFVPTITTHVWSTEVSRPWKSPVEFPVAVEPGRFFTANAQEIERIQGGPGAIILLAKDLPLPFDGYELFPPNATYAREVHAAGGYVEGDKLFWLDTLVGAVLGDVDFVELNCNHFLPRQVDTDLVRWSHWPVEFGYRGARGFALWMMDLYYRVLNAGVELPLSAGTASGVKAGPVGYDRVYVRLGDGAFDYAAFMRALRQGRSFSTNGPVLQLDVDGRFGPGDRIDLRPGREYRLRARARSRGALESLQLLVNGEVVAEQTGEGLRELTLEKAVRFDRSSWAAVRAFERGNETEFWRPAGLVFAHTSPTYFLLGRRPVVLSTAVQELMERIDRLIAHTQRLDGFRQESHRQETLKIYRAARDVLDRRLVGR